MSFAHYLRTRYVTACEMQRDILNDREMIEMLRGGTENPVLVKTWMESYGLFQGIKDDDRKSIAKVFLEYARNVKRPNGSLKQEFVQAQFKALLLLLHTEVQRSWISATSKLLWCVFPNDFVIYDAFVYRTLVVLQCVDDELSKFPRVGQAPKVGKSEDIDRAVDFYMNYQSMIRHLQTMNQTTLDELRKKHNEPYLHDVRIIDKLLWMIGNSRKKYSIAKAKCVRKRA